MDDIIAYKQAKQDLGGELLKEEESALDVVKSSKEDRYYEDDDGALEISWKSLMRKLKLTQ